MKMNIIIMCLLMFSFFHIVAGRNLPSPSSPNVNFVVVQPNLPPKPVEHLPPNVDFDAPPVLLPTLPPPPSNGIKHQSNSIIDFLYYFAIGFDIVVIIVIIAFLIVFFVCFMACFCGRIVK
jgi:hypothetical protein